MDERGFLVASLACVIAAEVVGVRRGNGATISALTADVFHTDTRAGRAAFVTFWSAFTIWYGRHIWRFVRSAGSSSTSLKGLTR